MSYKALLAEGGGGELKGTRVHTTEYEIYRIVKSDQKKSYIIYGCSQSVTLKMTIQNYLFVKKLRKKICQ